MRVWLVDTGPLIALLERKETHHAWTVDAIREAPLPLLTCEAVLTEAFFLLQRQKRDPNDLITMAKRGLIKTAFDFNKEKMVVGSLMDRYTDRPMSFADACLVRMTEIFSESVVFTLDGDFKIYRKNVRATIPLISPF